MKCNPATEKTLAFIFNAMLVFTTLPDNAWAFYDCQGGFGTFHLRGLVRGFGAAYVNPEDDIFYEDKSDANAAALARLLMECQLGQYLALELNTYQSYFPAELTSLQAGMGTVPDVERSGALEWSFSNDAYAHLAIDWLNVRLSYNNIDFIVGRQAVNLATTFYFTPNDFFAPFAAQTFYRVYKPGVDAVRIEFRLGNLSQLSLLSVLGYERDFDSDTGWSDGTKSERASYVGRISTVLNDIEWALIAGEVRNMNIIGGSVQGELLQWLGVRAEGHFADPDDLHRSSYAELSFGIEHRWENSLEIRLEQFYHGSGATSVSRYRTILAVAQAESYYLGRNYSAVGLSYEFSPLLNGAMLAIANLTDHSYLFSINVIYSLSDEAELVLNGNVPDGSKPDAGEIRSEYGLYPYSVNIEVRCYF